MNIICAFSSDSRDLYKADIYRVLALPTGHVVHFRYKPKWVDDNLLTRDAKLKQEKVAIFFSHGNDLENIKRQFEHIPVRWATISETEYSEETDVFHIYMKLDGFCNISIDTMNSLEKMPPTKFFSRLSCTEHNENNNWHSRINDIKDYFPELTFFHLKGITKESGHEVSLKYQNKIKSSYYNLTHGKRYILKVSLANPSNTTTQISISDSSEEITINSINPLETSIQFDDHDIPISIKTLQELKQASLLEFKPIGKDKLGEYATNIELNLRLSWLRPFIFGLLSTFAFWAVLLSKAKPESLTCPPDFPTVIASFLMFIATGGLFYWFNKK